MEPAVELNPLLTAAAIGMTEAEVEQHAQISTRDCRIVVTPSVKFPGCVATIESGVTVLIAYDYDDRVFTVITTDRRVRFQGLGVGSSYGDARTTLPNARVETLPCYGTFVEIAPSTWLFFDWHEVGVPDETTAASIAVRRYEDIGSVYHRRY